MDDESWIAWPVWDFVGVVATVLSLAAIVIAVVELFKQRRAVRPVAWDFDIWGTAIVDGDKYHVGDLHNAGSGTAEVLMVAFVNARTHLSGEYQFQRVFGSGERVRILVSARVIGSAWLAISWRDHTDRRRAHVQWMPVAHSGAMQAKYALSRQRTFKRSLSGWRSRHTTYPVGADYYAYASWRGGNAGDSAHFGEVLAPVFDSGDFDLWSYPFFQPTADISYVPPAAK